MFLLLLLFLFLLLFFSSFLFLFHTYACVLCVVMWLGGPQMDGLLKDESSLVFLLAASNLPWELDVAMLRRLEKRVSLMRPATLTHACHWRAPVCG